MGRSREQRQARRKQPRRKTQVHMHGWDDAYEADLSHEVRCDTNVYQWAARSVLSTACCARPCARWCSLLFIALCSSVMLLCVKVYALT